MLRSEHGHVDGLLDFTTMGSFRVQCTDQTTEEHLMISFQVNDMTCGHCVSTITKAVKAEDATATLQFDLAAHRVDIEAGQADAAELSEAIKQAGYAPVQIDGANASDGPSTAPARKGCCCG
jgi:copper chaperone